MTVGERKQPPLPGSFSTASSLYFICLFLSLPLTYPHPHPFHHKSGQLSLQNISDIHLPLSISMAMTLTLVQATTTGHLDYCNELPFYLSDSRLGLLQIHYLSNSHSDFWQSGSQHPSALNNSLLLHEDLPSSSASIYTISPASQVFLPQGLCTGAPSPSSPLLYFSLEKFLFILQVSASERISAILFFKACPSCAFLLWYPVLFLHSTYHRT